MTNFIQIQDVRLQKSTIKRYQPIGDVQLGIYFTASRAVRIDKEVFCFPNKKKRDDMIATLDAML
jgi:hypothetical protein